MGYAEGVFKINNFHGVLRRLLLDMEYMTKDIDEELQAIDERRTKLLNDKQAMQEAISEIGKMLEGGQHNRTDN